jgi:phosphoribosyl-ATP pyrophosphohydrolase/phosphoribosyl-AMP cyclohydrolase
MPYKKIIPYINAEGEIAANVIKLATNYANKGADELLVYNYDRDEESREAFLSLAKKLAGELDIPFIIGCFINRLEDVKKAFYTGAKAVLIKYAVLENKSLIKEASDRFGKNQIMVEVDMNEWIGAEGEDLVLTLAGDGAGSILLKHIEMSPIVHDAISKAPVPILIRDSLTRNDIIALIGLPNVTGLSTNFYENKDIRKVKGFLKESKIEVNTFESLLPFSQFKTDANGLIPVVVQDYKTDQVLMLAYMNEEAYNKTIAEGRMTYYSRSRQTLWVKGETSGHFQYVKELTLDCDKDTILARVLQIGPACHTGNQSCFFTDLLKKEYQHDDPYHVFQSVYDIIMDRKKKPKEGSYTNYLFDKGIDKILKKCGEEATEITIAAKNPGTEELRYEIADYLYHLMVLMAECGLDWNDVTNELAHRK